MPKRSDANQAEIVAALRKVGALVQDLHELGKGVPDLLVGYRGRLVLMEIKGPNGKLTPEEMVWLNTWGHLPVYVVRSSEEAINAIAAEVYL